MVPPSDTPSVTLALGFRPYQKTLVSSLLSEGMLRRVLSLGPNLEVQDPSGDGSLKVIKHFPSNRIVNRALWGIWRRLPRKWLSRPPIAATCWLADSLLSKCVEPTNIFHGSTAFCLASLHAARRQGAVTLVENGTRHPRHWREAAVEECRRFGVAGLEGGAVTPEVLILRMEREFEFCDRIVVPSTVARQSFAEMGYAEKTIVVLPAVDTQFFSPVRPAEAPPLFRACYVGRVQVTKGVGYLLQAWKRLALPHAELVLVGEVSPDMKPVLKTYANSSVRVLGTMTPAEIVRCYRESSLFVMPSVSEGLAEEVLEAMASGVAVVATDMSGANDCLANGKEGWIVPARDTHALADAILWCYQHPDEVRVMGEEARGKIESRFTLDHYNQRLMDWYRALAGTRKTSSADEQSQPRHSEVSN